MVTETLNDVIEQITEIKEQEAEVLAKIERNPQGAETLIQEEFNRIDKEIERVQKNIEETLNNKVFTTNTWNGWGYGG